MTVQQLEGFDINRTAAALTDRAFRPGSVLGAATFVQGRGYDAINHPQALAISNTTGTNVYLAGLLYDAVGWTVGLGINVNLMADELQLMSFKTAGGTNGEDLNIELIQDTASTFKVQVTRGVTVLGVTVAAFDYSTWHHIEVGALAANGATGSVEIRVSQNVELSLTNVQTSDNEAQFKWVNLNLAADPTGHISIDDLVISTGATVPAFQGDGYVFGVLPNAVGTNSDWTPLVVGDNYVQVDDPNAPDGDASYVASAANGDKDSYGFQNLPAIPYGNVLAVQLEADLRLVTSGSRNVKPLIRSGASEATGLAKAVITTSYERIHEVFENNPVTAAAWTAGEVDAAEFGVESVA